MTSQSSSQNRPVGICGVVLLVIAMAAVLLVFGGAWYVKNNWPNQDFVRGAQGTFNDQHIKTTVALVELHKLRFGRYPAALQDLKFTGQWDEMAIQSVRYVCDPQGSAYYVAISAPDQLTPALPAEFWRGTGYSETLKPSTP